MKKLYIIDAINYLFRSYFAIRGMSTPDGKSTNALYGFIRSMQKLIKDFSADHLVAVFDGPDNKKSRLKLYPDYKGHREGMPEDLFPQLDLAYSFCDYEGIPHLTMSGVEADDTIASIARWAEAKGIEVFVCSSDKDLTQLISKHIRMINTSKNNLLVDAAKVKEIYGVTPAQINDYLAIVGDSSDNVPGIAGFGPKTATTLLQENGDLETILANPECVKGPKKQETLSSSKDIARLSKKLTALDETLDIPKDEEFYLIKDSDNQALCKFYQEMHFSSLLNDLAEVSLFEMPAKEKPKTQKASQYILVDDEASLKDLIAQLSKEKEVCIDTETTELSPISAQLVGIGFGITAESAWYIPTNGKLGMDLVLRSIKPLLESRSIGFYGHHIKYDLHILLNHDIHLANIIFDTMLASYLLAPQNNRHNLDQLTLEHFNKQKTPIAALIGKGKNQISMKEVTIEDVSDYCGEDVDYTIRLKELYETELEKHDLKKILDTIEIPLIPVLVRMERNGIFIDISKLETMSKELTHALKDLEGDIHNLAGKEFNIKSPKQLSEILFDHLNIPSPTTKKSTRADVLESLQGDYPIIEKIMSFRALEKLRSTYVDTLPQQIHAKTTRIHCTFNQSVAATGRLSCQNPNLQNIPVRTPEGRKIRSAFKAEKPNTSFLSADYSQIELRFVAHMSGDDALISAFKKEEDIHAVTASLVFNVPLDKVTKEMRFQAKAVNFGIIYGQQAYGLSQQLGIAVKEAGAFINRYFEKHPKVKSFLEAQKEKVRQSGFAVTLTGRKRPIPDINSKNGMFRAAAERLAVNTPLQGTQADIIKDAMIQIDKELQKSPDLGLMILQIHDELIFETPDSHLEQLREVVQKTMENIIELKIPLTVNIAIGKNWGEC